MFETLSSFILGTASSLVANFIDGTLPVHSEKQLRGEFKEALKRAACELVATHGDLLTRPEQVDQFVPIASQELKGFLSRLASGAPPSAASGVALVRQKLALAYDGLPSSHYIGLFTASDERIQQLLLDYLSLIHEQVGYQSQLRGYYTFVWSQWLSDRLNGAQAQAGAALGQIQAALGRIENWNYQPRLLHPVHPDLTEFAPHPPEKQVEFARRFFAGRAPTWHDAATDYGIQRQGWRTSMAVALEQVNEAKAIVVSAVAGAGKSTEIYRLVLQLAREGHFAIYEVRSFTGDAAGLFAELEMVLNREEDRVPLFLLDGAAAALEWLKPLAARLRDRQPLVWLLCDRTERWTDALGHPPNETRGNELGVDEVEYVPLLTLSDDEVSELVSHLIAWGVLSEETPHAAWLKIFRERYAGQLLVTLLEAQTEDGQGNFKDRLREEAEQFGNHAAQRGRGAAALQKLYPAVAALHRFGISPTRAWLRQWLEKAGAIEALANEQAILDALDAEVLVATYDDRLQCRHEVIAEVVTTELLRGNLLTEVYDAWIRSTDPANADQRFALTHLFNFPVDRRRLWNVPDKLKLYQTLREHLPKDYIALSAAAYCAIRTGRPDLAEQWLANAGSASEQILQYLAAYAQRRGETVKAQQYYNRALGFAVDTAPDDALAAIEQAADEINEGLLSEWAGFLKQNLSRLDLAERIYRLLIEQGAADSLVYRELIWTRHRQGASADEIQNLFSQAEKDFPKEAPFFVMLRADFDPSHRRGILQKAIEAGREDAVVRFAYIRSLPRQTDAEKQAVLTQYRNAIIKYPKDSHIRHSFADFLEFCRRQSEAEQEYLKGVQADPSNPAFYISLALLYTAEKIWKKAEEWFQSGIKANPTNAHLYQAYALFLDKRGRYSDAETQFLAGINADPTNAPLYQAYALFLDKRGRYAEAEAQFLAGINADPTHAPLYQAYALFLDKRGRYAEAEAQFLAGINADPTHAHLYQAYALFLDKRGRYSDAEAQFLAGINADPTHAPSYQAYALFLDKRGRYAEAEAQFLAGINADPTSAHLWAGLVRFYSNLGFRRAAVACGRQSLQHASLTPPLTQTIARCLWALRYYHEAIELLQHGWELLSRLQYTKQHRPRWWAAQGQTLALYLAQMGRSGEALHIIKQARERAPQDTRLSQLEMQLSSSESKRLPLEGQLIAAGECGKLRDSSRKDYVWIYPVDSDRGIYARPDKNQSMPKEAWQPGLPLVYDLWKMPDGRSLAINVELEQWQWRGVELPVLRGLDIMPIPHAVFRNHDLLDESSNPSE